MNKFPWHCHVTRIYLTDNVEIDYSDFPPEGKVVCRATIKVQGRGHLMAVINEDHRVLNRADRGYPTSPRYKKDNPLEGLVEVKSTSNNTGTYRWLVFKDEWEKFCEETGYTS